MYQDYSARWMEFCETFNQPIKKMTDLNIKAIDKSIKRNQQYLENFLNAKQPEDIFTNNMKLMMEAQAETLEYMREASTAFDKFYSDMNKEFNDMATEFTQKASKAKDVRGGSASSK